MLKVASVGKTSETFQTKALRNAKNSATENRNAKRLSMELHTAVLKNVSILVTVFYRVETIMQDVLASIGIWIYTLGKTIVNTVRPL